MIEDACAIIVQAAAFAAAEILHKRAKNGRDADDARSVSAAAAAVESAAAAAIELATAAAASAWRAGSQRHPGYTSGA